MRVAAASAVLLKNGHANGDAPLPIARSSRVGLVGSACSHVAQIDPRHNDWRDGNYYGIGGSGRVY